MTKQAKDNRVETALTQEQIDATPKEVLDHLFDLSEDRRLAYEENEQDYRNKIHKIKNKILPSLLCELKYETDPKYIKSYKSQIKHQMNLVEKYKSELRLIRDNEDTLWQNALKIDKAIGLGYCVE